MKKSLCLLLVAALCLCMLAGCGGTSAPAASEAPLVTEAPAAQAGDYVTSVTDFLMPGAEMPNFGVEKTDGSMFILADELAKYDAVMINIWATWCNPCCMEMPVMQEAYEQYKDRIGLVCLSAFDENPDIIAFMEENGLDLPMGYDTVGLTDCLVWEGYPTTIMIDRFGNYAYYECGSILDVGGFTRMWDYFLSDSYTETQVVEEIPGAQYEGDLPEDAVLAADFSPNGTVSFVNDTSDPYNWPFLPAGDGVFNSNALVTNTEAIMNAELTVEAGAVFTFDFCSDFESFYDQLAVYVNDELVKLYAYAGEGTFAYQFAEAGDYTVSIAYDQMASAAETETGGTVLLSNARIVTGKDADAVLAAQPVYTYALEGEDYALEVLTAGAKRIQLNFPEGMEENAEYYNAVEMYVVPADTVSVRMLLGDAYDAETACGVGDFDYVYHVCAQCENEGNGYVFETPLSSVELGGYENTYVSLIPDITNYDNTVTIYIFKNEENVNYFVMNSVLDVNTYENIEGVTWQYEDGTLPSTDALPGGTEEYTYNIYLVDENGDPVDGVMVNVCTDQNCTPAMTSGGYYGFDGEPYPYVIHVLTVPAGYAFDTTQEFVMDEAGDTLTIVVPHA